MHASSTDRRIIQFRRGTSAVNARQTLWYSGLLLLIPLVVVAALLLNLASQDGPMSAADLWQALLRQFDKDPRLKSHAWAFAIALPIAVIPIWLHRLSFLRLGPHGIEGYLPKGTVLGMHGLTTGHWRVLWDAIRSVQLIPARPMPQLPMRLAAYRLVIETDRGPIRLSPYFWILRNGPDHRMTLRRLLSAKATDADRMIETAPLIEALRARGIEIAGPETATGPSAPAGFDMSKHRGLVIQLVAFFAIGLYALIDGLFINAYRPLEPMPMAPYGAAAAIAIVLVAILGRGAPIVERGVVGALTIAVTIAAVHPALLRINALTAEPRVVAYESVAIGRFEPPTPDLPEIDLGDLQIGEYWARYPAGAEHEFHLLRGAAGFYQLDLDPLYARTRDFYRQQG